MYCDQRVCVFVCLHISKTTRPNIFSECCLWTYAAAQSLSNDRADSQYPLYFRFRGLSVCLSVCASITCTAIARYSFDGFVFPVFVNDVMFFFHNWPYCGPTLS